MPNAYEVYAHAKVAGAEIVIEIKDEDYGGRGFSCRDPESHLWNVGTYDPWKATSWWQAVGGLAASLTQACRI